MPIVKDWFDEDKEEEWEIWEQAYHYNQKEGPEYLAYPLLDIIPNVRISQAEIANISSKLALWITEIDPYSSVGKVNSKNEGTYIIDLPKTFGEYLETLEYDHRKKNRYNIRKNEDLKIEYDNLNDINILWDNYVEKIQSLSIMQEEGEYEEERLALRKEFFFSRGIKTISFYDQDQLIAVNVCKQKEGTIFDLACLRDDKEEHKNRGIGVFATLMNIQRAIDDKVENYDMLSSNFGYKTKFGAKEVKMRHYLRCNLEFARAYDISEEDISEII